MNFDAKCDDWCTYKNFLAMHDSVCAAMVKWGVAVELQNEAMVMLEGKVTDNASEM